MNLHLTPVRYKNILDDETFLDYSTYQGLNTIRINRALFGDSMRKNERVFDGYYFNYHEFKENGNFFATLQPYRIKAAPLSKRLYSFGCFETQEDPSMNKLYFFFKGKGMADSRQQAVEVYNALTQYCSQEFNATGRVLTPFAMKY